MTKDAILDIEAAMEACRKAMRTAPSAKTFRIRTLLEMLIRELENARAVAGDDARQSGHSD